MTDGIEERGLAQQTKAAADEGVFQQIDAEPMEGKTEEEIAAVCTDGHIRRKTYKGVCYCQMCCGGSWLYFYRVIGGKRVYVKCGDSPVTVDCAGNHWILTC